MHNQKGPAGSGGREEEEKEEEECAFIISLWGISPTHLLLLSLPGSCVWQRRHCPQEVSPPLCSDRSFLRRSSFGPRGRRRKGLSAPSRLTTAFKRRGNKTTLGAIIASGHKRLSSSPSFCLPLSLLFFSYFFPIVVGITPIKLHSQTRRGVYLARNASLSSSVFFFRSGVRRRRRPTPLPSSSCGFSQNLRRHGP